MLAAPRVARGHHGASLALRGRVSQARLRSRSRNGSSTTVASTRLRRPSTVHSTASLVPSASCAAPTEASAMACLRIGLQPWLVARPTWRPAGEDRDRRPVDRSG